MLARANNSDYGLAAGVVIWLGEASTNSAAAFDTLRYLGQQIEITDDGWKFTSFDPPASVPSWFNTQVVLPYNERGFRLEAIQEGEDSRSLLIA